VHRREHAEHRSEECRVFAAMHDLERGDPKVFEFCRAMEKTRRSDLKWLKPAWDQLVKRRATWLTRIKLTMF